jgi:hypothetical protein
MVIPFSPFGPTIPEGPAELAEELVVFMIERCKGWGVDTGDVASLVALELVASLSAYGRAPLGVVMGALAEAAPGREVMLREANRHGERPPPLNIARLTAIAPAACRLN